MNCHLLLGDINCQLGHFETALQNYSKAICIDVNNGEALKGVLLCNYKLKRFDETWDFVSKLNLEAISDPLVFVGLFNIGYACIQEFEMNEEADDVVLEEIKNFGIQCNNFLNLATLNTSRSNISLQEEIARNYYKIRNYQSAT